MRKRSSNNLVWIDLELTGLNIKTDKILEVACVITDKNLEFLTDVLNLVIKHPKSILNSLDDWSLRTHTKSGLIQEVLSSKVSIKEAQNRVLEFIEPFIKPRQNLLAGSSVHFDKIFISKYMPNLEQNLKWQIIDVATVRNLAYRWYKIKPFPKQDAHRASIDIVENIEELKYLKKEVFKP